MTEQEFNQAVDNGDVNFLPQQSAPQPEPLKPFSLDEYQAIVEALRRPRRHLTAAPTFTPKSFLDQIQFSDISGTRKAWFYINGAWYSVTVT